MPRKSVNLSEFVDFLQSHDPLECQNLSLNSPRSLQACSACGIDPSELLPIPVEAFQEHVAVQTTASTMERSPTKSQQQKQLEIVRDLEAEAAQIRYEHYERTRQSKLELVQKAYNRLSGGGSSSLHSSGQVSHQPSTVEVDSTMVAVEERRLERIKQRQEKEIQSLIEMETKMAELQRQNAVREQQEMKRRAEWEKERKKKRVEAVAAKHERELKRKAQEEEEAQRRRTLAKRQAEREKQILEEEKKQEILRQKEALERDKERITKAEEHRRQTEALLKAQEDQALENRNRMLEREKVVKEKMQQIQLERQELALQRREKAEKRIHEALRQNQQVIIKRKEEFDKKQALGAERAREASTRQQQQLIKRREKQTKEEQLRSARLKQARQIQQDRVTDLVKRRAELDSHLEDIYQERDREHTLMIIQKNLKLEEKKRNVDRIKRVDEYNREQVLRKIALDDTKSRAIKMKKQNLIQARKNFALESQMRKHQIADAVEKMRVTNNWGSIDKLLNGKGDEKQASEELEAKP